MANYVLFLSAAMFGLLHIYYITRYPLPNSYRWFTILLILGIISSLLNQGLTHSYLTIFDRFIMAIGLPIDVYLSLYIPQSHKQVIIFKLIKINRVNICLFGIFFAAFSYFTMKFILSILDINRRNYNSNKVNKDGAVLHVITYLPHISAHACLSCVHCYLLKCYHYPNKEGEKKVVYDKKSI